MIFTDVHRGSIVWPDDWDGDFICDIDGTVANLEHRLHWIKTKPKNWKAFAAGVSYDTPITPVIEVVQSLVGKGCRMVMCSGRNEYSRKDTEVWLEENGLNPVALYMRKNGDYRRDDIIKEELLNQIIKDGFNPELAFDDRDRVVAMWRKRNLECIQVSEGDF